MTLVRTDDWSMCMAFHLFWLSMYLAAALAISLVNGLVESRDGYLSYWEAVGLSIVPWGIGMATFYGVVAALMELGPTSAVG